MSERSYNESEADMAPFPKTPLRMETFVSTDLSEHVCETGDFDGLFDQTLERLIEVGAHYARVAFVDLVGYEFDSAVYEIGCEVR